MKHDIETPGFPFESFDEKQQEYLTKLAKREEKRAEAIQKLALTPLTGHRVFCGGCDGNRGVVLPLA